MNLEQLKEIKSKIFDIVSNNLEGTKNKEYANEYDVFKNFNKAARLKNKKNYAIAHDYSLKHTVSIDDIFEQLENADLKDSDIVVPSLNTIEEKFTDEIGYLILKYGMIKEEYEKAGLLKEEQDYDYKVTRENGDVIYGFADTDFDDIETEPEPISSPLEKTITMTQDEYCEAIKNGAVYLNLDEPNSNIDLSYILERAKSKNATINGLTTDEFESLMNGGKIDVTYRFEQEHETYHSVTREDGSVIYGFGNTDYDDIITLDIVTEPVKAPYKGIRPIMNIGGCE